MPDLNPGLEGRVEDLLTQMTLEEKVALMAGASPFGLNGVPRLGVPAIQMTDGPTGVRAVAGQAATVFPVGVAVAATWNPELAQEIGAAIAREARALDAQVVLAPTVNIVRTPVWGRNFETYSEDPFLAGRLGVGYVRGLQGEGVGASLKHYAANNQELHRFQVDVQADERTLREIYLAAFEMVVEEANPWTIMASYNRLNGPYASEHPWLLNEVLKGEWGYDGVVVSDWGATHSTAEAATAGLDLEMPGPPKWFGDKLLAAVRAGEVEGAVVDEAARRMLRLILRVTERPAGGGELRTPRHAAIARQAAEESLVLLKNDVGLLPLDRSAIRTLAVIGPNADVARIQGGGSSRVNPGGRTTPLSALQALLGEAVRVTYAQGCDSEPTPRQAQARDFSPTLARDRPGMLAETFDEDGGTLTSQVEAQFWRRFSDNIAAESAQGFAGLRWSGVFWPRASGRHEFSLKGAGEGTITLEGEALVTPQTEAIEDREDLAGRARPRRTAGVMLEAGRGYAIEVAYHRAPGREEFVAFGVRHPSGGLDKALEAAKAADAVVLVVGSASATEGEGYDRADLDLPGPQNALVEAVLAANPRTVVVLNTGAPVTVPWAGKAATLMQMWLPGEAGPAALAAVLFGDAAPSGRLPVTFPRRLEDTPAYPFYNDDLKVDYGEGVFVGYRRPDRAGIAPLFPFGHGLTYGEVRYAGLTAPDTARVGAKVEAIVRLDNPGARAVKETVQLYVRPLNPAIERPDKELKAFRKVEVAAGGSVDVGLTLPPRAFAYFSPTERRWIVEAGEYEILAGASAGDIRLRATVSLRA